MLQQLLYVSAASKAISAEDVTDILAAGQRNNPARGITGILLFTGESFLQVLEGTPDVIDDIYRKISRDPRHSGALVLVRRSIARRAFPHWSMGYRGPDREFTLDGDSFALTRDALAARLEAGGDEELRVLLDTFCTMEFGTAA